MKHMNKNLAFLLSEGFSINTLNKMNSNQLSVLSEKVKKYKKETKEQAKPVEKTVTSKVIELPTGAETVVGGQKIKNDAGKTVITTTTTEGEVTEKSVSKKQHGLMGAAYSVEKGDKKLSDIPKSYRKKVKDVVDSMSKKQLKDFAKTKTSKLPEKKEEVKKLEESILRLISDEIYPTTTKSELLKMINRHK